MMRSITHRVLGLLPRHTRLPILSGPARGLSWELQSSTYGCWVGTYEHEKQMLLVALVRSGSVVYDVGAHVGFYSLLLSRLVGPRGRVLAFEPFDENLGYLTAHVQANRLLNVEIVRAAVSDHPAILRFAPGSHSTMGRLHQEGSVSVEAVSLDDIVFERKRPAPALLKIDVEGAELHVLIGAKRVLTEIRPLVLLAMHGWEMRTECLAFLRDAGYRIEQIGRDHAEIVAYPLDMSPTTGEG